DPNLDECFVAERGGGAFLEDRRLAVSLTAGLGASLLATGFPYDVRDTADNNLAEYAAFTRRNRSVRELGSAAITLAAVDGGPLDREAPALVASNGHIHSEMIAVLQEVRAR